MSDRDRAARLDIVYDPARVMMEAAGFREVRVEDVTFTRLADAADGRRRFTATVSASVKPEPWPGGLCP